MKTLRAGLILLAIGLLSSPGVAKNEPGLAANHPLLARLAAASVTRGREHRAMLVYPIVADAADPAKVERALTGTEARANQGISIGEPDKQPGRQKVEIFNWTLKPILLLAGEVLKGGIRDRYLTRDVLVGPGKKVTAPVLYADLKPRKKEDESQVLEPFSAVAPDIMRLVGVADAPTAPAAKYLGDQFGIAGEKGDRRSIPELFEAKALGGRISEYRTIYEAIPDEGGKKTIGAAVWVGERLIGIDVFESNAAFRAHWPALSRTSALQAALYEAAYGLLNQPFPAGRDPDRHAPRVKEVLKKLFAAQARKVQAVGLGTEIELLRGDTVGRCLTLDKHLVHAVVLLDYLDGGAALPPPPGSTPTEFTQGELERRAERGTITEYEKRLLERMRERNQPPQKLDPSRNQPPQKIEPPRNQPQPQPGLQPGGPGRDDGFPPAK
jgi:hypothetical protein